jgi:hypothetical protein
VVQQGWADEATVANWRGEVLLKIEEAVAMAQREPAPDPFSEKWSALATEQLQEGNE